jgi:hypothetical protein
MKISSRITDLETLLIIFEAKLNSIDTEHTANPTPATTTAHAAVKSVNQNENSQHSVDENTMVASSSSGSGSGSNSDVRNSNNDQLSSLLDRREAVNSFTHTATAEDESIRPFPPPPPPPPPPPSAAPTGSVLSSISAIAIGAAVVFLDRSNVDNNTSISCSNDISACYCNICSYSNSDSNSTVTVLVVILL